LSFVDADKWEQNESRSVVARGRFANWHFIAPTAAIVLAVFASGVEASDTAPAQSQGRTVTNSDMLGTKARQAVIDIFRKKDVTAVDRYFGEPFTQHDPNLADGLAGMKSFAAEIASSPNANVKIYRTLVDEDFVLLHSIYEGVARYGGSAIAFDLFRFNDGKIVEHWGGQEPQAPPNLSGRTQVDGPSEIVDREKTEDNRTLVRTYRETVMLSLRFDRIGDFIDDAHYAQHASTQSGHRAVAMRLFGFCLPGNHGVCFPDGAALVARSFQTNGEDEEDDNGKDEEPAVIREPDEC
jgi:predicted SnoaL-like aldol condensation-catalyzing enzyme